MVGTTHGEEGTVYVACRALPPLLKLRLTDHPLATHVHAPSIRYDWVSRQQRAADHANSYLHGSNACKLSNLHCWCDAFIHSFVLHKPCMGSPPASTLTSTLTPAPAPAPSPSPRPQPPRPTSPPACRLCSFWLGCSGVRKPTVTRNPISALSSIQ